MIAFVGANAGWNWGAVYGMADVMRRMRYNDFVQEGSFVVAVDLEVFV